MLQLGCACPRSFVCRVCGKLEAVGDLLSTLDVWQQREPRRIRCPSQTVNFSSWIWMGWILCFENLLQIMPDSWMSPTFVLQKASSFIQYLCGYLSNTKRLSMYIVLGVTSWSADIQSICTYRWLFQDTRLTWVTGFPSLWWIPFPYPFHFHYICISMHDREKV